MSSWALFFISLSLASSLLCQAQANDARKPSFPERTIDLKKGAALPGLPFSGITASPFTCSPDGQLFIFEIGLDKEGEVKSTMPVLYRVSAQGEVKQIPISTPDGYKHVSSTSFFAGSNALATVIRASEPTEQNGGQSKPTDADYFLSTSDLDGDHARLVRLDLHFDVAKAAVFSSGEFLALGADDSSSVPVIALLQPDGRVIRQLEIFPKKDQSSAASTGDATRKPQPDNSSLIKSIGTVRFVPWGNDIVMAAPAIDGEAIYHFRPSGTAERFPIKMPSGEQIHGIIAAGGHDDWVVRTISAASLKLIAKVRLIENPEEYLYEVNPRNGEILRQLRVLGPVPGEVACAADGKLSALFVGEPPQQGASLKLSLAIASR